MYVTIGTLQKKVKNLTLTVREFNKRIVYIHTYRASHIRVISEFILYATKNTNDADYLIPFIM
jgi:hypothetical protein